MFVLKAKQCFEKQLQYKSQSLRPHAFFAGKYEDHVKIWG